MFDCNYKVNTWQYSYLILTKYIYKYNLAESNTNTLLYQISIQILLQIQISSSNTLPFFIQIQFNYIAFLKCYSNMIQIRASITVQLYHNEWNVVFGLTDCCRLTGRQFD